MFLVDLWHGLGLVFIKVCRSGHYPFWLRAANSQWEPSGLQCSQPSPGIAGFAVRKKVSCEQAHLVRVSGALHWFVTQPHEDARKLGKKVPLCHSLGFRYFHGERAEVLIQIETRVCICSVQCIWHIRKCKLIRSLKQGVYFFVRRSTGLPSWEVILCLHIFFFRIAPAVFTLFLVVTSS